jgi:hypothetical protein
MDVSSNPPKDDSVYFKMGTGGKEGKAGLVYRNVRDVMEIRSNTEGKTWGRVLPSYLCQEAEPEHTNFPRF